MTTTTMTGSLNGCVTTVNRKLWSTTAHSNEAATARHDVRLIKADEGMKEKTKPRRVRTMLYESG